MAQHRNGSKKLVHQARGSKLARQDEPSPSLAKCNLKALRQTDRRRFNTWNLRRLQSWKSTVTLWKTGTPLVSQSGWAFFTEVFIIAKLQPPPTSSWYLGIVFPVIVFARPGSESFLWTAGICVTVWERLGPGARASREFAQREKVKKGTRSQTCSDSHVIRTFYATNVSRKNSSRAAAHPPATSPVASEMSLDCSEESQSSTGSGRRYYISPVDQYLMTLNPDHKPTSEEALIKTVLRGKDRSHLEEAWTRHVAQANRIVTVAKLKAKPHKADKPKEGEASVMYYDIPDSESLAIRRWDGNMQEYGLYCFDLYDTSKRIAINLPDNYKICNVPHTGAFVIGGSGSEVKSWEMTWGVLREDTLPGQERFVVPEGSHLVLFRPDKQPFFFALPTRPRVYRGVAAIFAQARH